MRPTTIYGVTKVFMELLGEVRRDNRVGYWHAMLFSSCIRTFRDSGLGPSTFLSSISALSFFFTSQSENELRSFEGIVSISSSLQVLDASKNQVSSISHLEKLRLLQRLDISDNKLTDLDQLLYLIPIRVLKSLNVRGNLMCEFSELFRVKAIYRLPQLTELDGEPVTAEDIVKSEIAHGADEELRRQIELKVFENHKLEIMRMNSMDKTIGNICTRDQQDEAGGAMNNGEEEDSTAATVSEKYSDLNKDKAEQHVRLDLNSDPLLELESPIFVPSASSEAQQQQQQQQRQQQQKQQQQLLVLGSMGISPAAKVLSKVAKMN